MGDKNDSKSKHGKKLTTKEKKAQNHLKLMQGSKDRNATTDTVAITQNKDKKAAQNLPFNNERFIENRSLLLKYIFNTKKDYEEAEE